MVFSIIEENLLEKVFDILGSELKHGASTWSCGGCVEGLGT
jgi:hypothetical protein